MRGILEWAREFLRERREARRAREMFTALVELERDGLIELGPRPKVAQANENEASGN